MIFNIRDIGAFTDFTHTQIYEAGKRGVLSAAIRLVQVIHTELIPAEDPPPIDQHFYEAGWRYVETAKGADVFNDMPYASVIEYGARADQIKPGKRMIDALAEWVVRKGFTPKTEGNIQATADIDKAARGMAWAIAMSMMGFGDRGKYPRRGIFNRDEGEGGLRIAEKAAARAEALIREEITAEIKEALG